MPATVIPAPAFPWEWQWAWFALNNSPVEQLPWKLWDQTLGILLQESADRGLEIFKWHPLSGEDRETSVNICSQASKSPVSTRPQPVSWQDGYQEEDIPKGVLPGDNPWAYAMVCCFQNGLDAAAH